MTRATLVTTLALILVPATAAVAQGDEPSQLLDTVSVEAYASDRPTHQVPASVGILDPNSFRRYNHNSLLPAFNLVPGVRMEERSPGSYRFSIRGSLLRSPFGVRNVKFYWNGLPLTDGGGNTYLNILDLQSVNRAEVIKGPAGSLYGAGTGGVVLLRSAPIEESAAGIMALGGSFGTYRLGAMVESTSDDLHSRMQFVRQSSAGYRQQSALERTAFQGDMLFPLGPSDLLDISVLYTDLHYQTPGGLTEAQYQSNPQQARPPSGPIPGAVSQQAAVFNRTVFSGVRYEHQWSASWSSALGIVASSTEFKNPTIRNYEERQEQNAGARLTTTWERVSTTHRIRVVIGAEYQHFRAPIVVSTNVAGTPGTVLSDDKVTSILGVGFAQTEVELPKGLQLVGGLSINYAALDDERAQPLPAVRQHKVFDPVLLPRLAMLKKINPSLTAFASVSRGFSPPTVAELVPSTGIYNAELNPESGWSLEGGLRGWLGKEFGWQVSVYDFRLDNAIVLQRDSTGADYYVNAGSTLQPGVEASFEWRRRFTSFIRSLQLNGSVAYTHYRFGTYVSDGNDYSGNVLTGVPPWTLVLGADAEWPSRVYTTLNVNYTARIPLNDANTDYASDYLLVGIRVGRQFEGRLPVDFFAGVDNLLDIRYSLGNDLNAAGKRYFNAAPGINYYVGLRARLAFRKEP